MSQAPLGPTAAAPPPWPPQQPPNPRGPSRMPAIIAIAIALVAVAVAIAAWFKPAPKAEVPPVKTYTEQETADAKKAVCEAFDRVQLTLQSTSYERPPDPSDAMQKFVLAVNGRLAAYAGADYLYRQAAANPAAPSSLSAAIGVLASAYQDATLSQLANADRAKLDQIYRAADAAASTIKDTCK